MKNIPGAFWFVLISSLVAGLIPVLNQFWPTATVWWSAIIVVILGAILAAVNAWKQMQTQPPATPPGVAMTPDMAQHTPRRGFVKTWLFGGR